MQIMIGCAKDMTPSSMVRPELSTVPMFAERALHNALQIAAYDEDELRGMLGCNISIARQNRLRYLHFADPAPALQAVLAYAGIVYKYMGLGDFSAADFSFAHCHLWITSFLYGLLRPMDMIKNYRLEGNVVLPENGESMFNYWKPVLTDVLIDTVKDSGGVLVDLASSEMRRLFDWRRVGREVRVIRPEFAVRRGGSLKTVVVYAKMCRGSMARYIIKERLSSDGELRRFAFEGFCYSESESKENSPAFILE